MSLLSVDGLDCRYGLLQAVRDVSFEINNGETLALIGANGAGKTTLLRAIAGAHRPHGGRITYNGRDIGGLAAHRVAAGRNPGFVQRSRPANGEGRFHRHRLGRERQRARNSRLWQ